MKKQFRIFSATAVVSFAVALSACSGGGGGDASGTTALEPGLTIAAAKCLGTAGPFDAAQNAISTGLGNLSSSLPQGANVAGKLASAASHLLDSPDALIAALQNLAANHDPQAFAAELTAAGDGLRCGLAYTDAALIDLTQQLQNMSASVPALPGVIGQIKGIESLLGQSLIGAVDLSNLTTMLSALPGPLSQVSAQLPAGLKIPNIALPLSMIGNTASGVAVVLDRLAHLDAAGAQGALTGLAVSLAGIAGGPAALGLPSAVVQPIYTLLLTGNTQVLTNLVPYLGPLLNAVTQVLTYQGGAQIIFQQILMGGLSGLPASGQFGTLLAMLGGGGVTGGGLPIPLLADVLARLIPGGVPL